MPDYKKIGYLTSSFKIFHLTDDIQREFHFHYHDFHKILLLISGDITYCIEGRSYDLAPNDIVLVNAGEVHKPVLHSNRTYERIIIYISPDFLQQYQESGNDLTLCFRQALAEQSHVLRPSHVKDRFFQIIEELKLSLSDQDYACALSQQIHLLDFLIQLNRLSLHKKMQFIKTSASNPKILAVMDYLNHHLTEDITIDTLANQFHFSRYYLMHTFKEETGDTIGNYLTTKRLLLAKDLIAQGTPITNACYACGFHNYSTFSRAYRKNFMEAPRMGKLTE